jgi:hypothetical protein
VVIESVRRTLMNGKLLVGLTGVLVVWAIWTIVVVGAWGWVSLRSRIEDARTT